MYRHLSFTFLYNNFQCIEKCKWKCDHERCSKLCSEPCDRKLCKHPNTEKLPCGHQSIGICGEKMPKLCRVCNKDEVENVIIGEVNVDVARFIQLEDCEHIIEENDLLYWMNSDPESNSNSNGNTNNERNTIQFKKCTSDCPAIIRHTKSVNTYIQTTLRDIEHIKSKTLGLPEANNRARQILSEKVNGVLKYESFNTDPFSLRNIYQSICDELIKPLKPMSNQLLIEQSNKFELVEKLRNICSAFDRRSDWTPNIPKLTIEKFSHRLELAASFIRQFKNCEQHRTDIFNEMLMLQLMSDLIVQISGLRFAPSGLKLLGSAFEVANKYGAATESIRKEFQSIASEANQYCVSKIKISLQEKEMILNAMGLSRGHWYKCPKGHVYAIGDCGGAMQQSKCPECGLAIGGDNHRLVSGNRVAPEMDGATVPAWPQ